MGRWSATEGAIPRAVRLVHIIERLRAGETLYASDLADEYGCSQRAVERDFRALARAPLRLPLERVGWGWKLRARGM